MSARNTYLISFLVISVLLLTSLYLQYFDNVIPCPLCILQRFTFVLLGFWLLLGLMVHAKRWGRWLVNSLVILTSAFGMFLAGRQLWLQYFATNKSDECGVSISYMMQVLPLHEVAQKIFAGSAECSQVGWSFLSLNMAAWAFIWFALFLGAAVYWCMNDKRNKRY